MKNASPELEAFIDELIGLGAQRGYHPTVFMSMRSRYGTRTAMHRLVLNGDVETGFKRLTELGLQDHTVEAGILKFRGEFDQSDIECAEWRLNQAAKEASA